MEFVAYRGRGGAEFSVHGVEHGSGPEVPRGIGGVAAKFSVHGVERGSGPEARRGGIGRKIGRSRHLKARVWAREPVPPALFDVAVPSGSLPPARLVGRTVEGSVVHSPLRSPHVERSGGSVVTSCASIADASTISRHPFKVHCPDNAPDRSTCNDRHPTPTSLSHSDAATCHAEELLERCFSMCPGCCAGDLGRIQGCPTVSQSGTTVVQPLFKRRSRSRASAQLQPMLAPNPPPTFAPLNTLRTTWTNVNPSIGPTVAKLSEYGRVSAQIEYCCTNLVGVELFVERLPIWATRWPTSVKHGHV